MASRPAPQRSSQEMGERFDYLPADANEAALLVMSREGRLTSWNAAAERLFGYEAAEIIGKHFSRFFSPQDLSSGRPAVEIRSALSAGFMAHDCWQIRKDGTRFWCQVTLSSQQDQDGNVLSLSRVMGELDDPDAIVAQASPTAVSAH